MIKAIKQFIGFIFFVGPIALFWFIPWYWVVLYYNLYWTYTSYILYEANKDGKELSLLYCISLPLLFNFFGFLVVILTESKSKKVNEEPSANHSSDTFESNQIVVKTNKELRERLNNLGISDDNLQSINVKLNLNKWATYESDVNVMGLEYKGYKYDLVGYMQEKRNDAELVKEIKSLNEFFKIIKDKEIDRLDYDFEYYKNGESDYHYIDEVDWFDKMPPKEIIEEFDAKYKKGKYHQYDELIDQGETVNLGESRFLNEFNNIDMIVLNLKVQNIEYSIHWNNHNAGKCVECDVEVEKGIRFCDDCEKKREKMIKSLDKAIDRLEKIYPTKTGENDESSDNNKTEKSSYQKAIDLEQKERKERIDFSISKEEFKVEPIKSLYDLSRELPEKEYFNKAKGVWKDYMTNFLKRNKKKIDNEHYTKINLNKDLFYIDLEYTRDDHCRLIPRLRTFNYEFIKEEQAYDGYELEGFFGSNDESYQISYIDFEKVSEKYSEPLLVFMANSSWIGNYTDKDIDNMGGYELYGLDEILQNNQDPSDLVTDDASYEYVSKFFFSFDQICEYLAKCPIYDYKETLDAGALFSKHTGNLDFTSFDISNIEKTKNDINFCPNCGVKITEKINFCGDCGQKLN
jgi:hypothetical protein